MGLITPGGPKSVTKAASVSLATYTFNDHALAAGLLADVASWTAAPREIIVVDDGTPEPFVPPPNDDRVKVIRHERNLGCAAANAAGLDAGTCKYLLSIDADIRLPADWLAKCLPVAARKDVGMVSTRIAHKTGSTVLDAYLDAMYSRKDLKGFVKFLPGPVYLMRKEAYDAVGGLSDYQDTRGQDTYLCRNIVERGLGLYRVPDLTAHQTRKLSLPQCVKRCISWDIPYFERRMARHDAFEELLPLFIAGTGNRMEKIENAGGLVQYVHLAFILYGCVRIAGWYGETFSQGVWRSFGHFLRERPQIRAALALEVNRFGAGEYREDAEGPRFAGLGGLLGSVFPENVLGAMDAALAHGRVDEPPRTDFSMYEAD